MKKSLFTFLLVGATLLSYAQKVTVHKGYPFTPVPFTAVKVTDSFWGQRLKANREVTIPLAFSKCEETGRYDNFVRAAHRGSGEMAVWLPIDVNATRPVLLPTIASESPTR